MTESAGRGARPFPLTALAHSRGRRRRRPQSLQQHSHQQQRALAPSAPLAAANRVRRLKNNVPYGSQARGMPDSSGSSSDSSANSSGTNLSRASSSAISDERGSRCCSAATTTCYSPLAAGFKPARSTRDRLRELRDIYQEGLCTEEQYSKRQEQLLDDL